ncbi:MAG: DUF4294 domain-containing protein [Bacteroidia bacterium]|nr:DUF4294 domain-containing protein [Bacteroidia bacterium]
MKKHFFILIIITILVAHTYGQQDNWLVVNTTVYNGDTIPLIMFEEVVIVPPLTFKNKKEAVKYTKLVRKIRKVLPYARLAGSKLDEIEAAIVTMTSEREKRRFIDKKDKELRAEFEGELSELTVSEGLMLIKLIDRETGDTSYELIKELKGSLTAFMWQTVARMFGSNLKLEYDAQGEDKLIEDIILRIDNGLL